VHGIKARPLPHVPGRKTDVCAGQWRQPLHPDGRLRGAVRPDADLCALRADSRQRDPRIRSRSAPVPPRQTAVPLRKGPLTNGLSDITGVTGLPIIRALGPGERDPHTLAAYRNEPGAKREAAMAQAFTGHDRPAPRWALTQALEWPECYHPPISACDQEIAPKDAAFTPQVALTAPP